MINLYLEKPEEMERNNHLVVMIRSISIKVFDIVKILKISKMIKSPKSVKNFYSYHFGFYQFIKFLWISITGDDI